MQRMSLFWLGVMCLALSAQTAPGPQFNAQGELARPEDYREWVYLGTGLGMTYFDAGIPRALEAPFFDSVFVNPPAWRQFRQTGNWPEGTIFVLEIRYSAGQSGINKAGFFQRDIASVEAAVKDSKRFSGAWGYFQFGNGLTGLNDRAREASRNAGCIACHTANGAVENTFTQFYPEALRIAQQHKTLKASYAGAEATATPVEFAHALGNSGWPAATALLEKASAKDPQALILREEQQNQIAYALLQKGKKEEAVALLTHVTNTHPLSANAWDSLAEALEASGEREKALAAATKVLTLLPQDKKLRPAQIEQLEKIAKERIARLKK